MEKLISFLKRFIASLLCRCLKYWEPFNYDGFYKNLDVNMEKKLAIKGHAIRGKEVIEILEMLGGYNTVNWFGDDIDAMYFISTDRHIDNSTIKYSYTEVFTLEEFLEKFPYKVGDKVVYTKFGDNYPIIIQAMKWT